MRMIDADECFRLAGVEHNVCDDCLEHKIREDCLGCPMLHIKEALAEAPTIDAVPVIHARWIKECMYAVSCSNCGHTDVASNYCPNCGANMNEVIE